MFCRDELILSFNIEETNDIVDSFHEIISIEFFQDIKSHVNLHCPNICHSLEILHTMNIDITLFI